MAAKAKDAVQGNEPETDEEFGRLPEKLPPVTRKAKAQLLGHEIQPAGIHYSHWAVMSKEEHTIDDVLGAGYLWAKHEQFRPGDTIEIKHPLGLFVVQLDLIRVDELARGIVANVRNVFNYATADAIAHMVKPELEDVKIELLGARGWSIIDGNHVINSGFKSEAAAKKWLADRAMAA